jgi:hypothetical protein
VQRPPGCRSQSDTPAGCIVWSTTVSSSSDSVEVDVLAQAGAERLNRLGRIVAASVEAPVHYRLNAPPSRLEQRRPPGWRRPPPSLADGLGVDDALRGDELCGGRLACLEHQLHRLDQRLALVPDNCLPGVSAVWSRPSSPSTPSMIRSWFWVSSRYCPTLA